MSKRLLDQIKGSRAVVLGDLMLDEYIHGTATRISPEAPVMVIRREKEYALAGGAANVAKNAAALGAEVTVIGVVGRDEAGENLAQTLEDRTGIEPRLVLAHDRGTTRKTRILADHAHQVVRIDDESDEPITETVEAQLLMELKSALDAADLLILSDYRKGVLTEALVPAAIRAAQEAKVPVAANPKPQTAPRYRGAALISLNRPEMKGLMGEAPKDREDAIMQARRAAQHLEVGCVLATLGGDGLAAAWANGSASASAPNVEVADPAGAGDTVIAAAALGMAKTGLSEHVMRFAAESAARVVRRVGVAVPQPEDLVELSRLGF